MTQLAAEPDPSITVTDGFPDADRREIAEMYWAAFGAKLRVALSPGDRAIGLLTEAINPKAAIVARTRDGHLLGVAGYKTAQSAFAAIDFQGIRRHFGAFGGLWRTAVFSLLSRRPVEGTLLMDGIFVAERARGQGVGSLLLNAVKRKASEHGCGQVRLDVIDTNPRAQKLYEREGFRPVAVQNLGPLRHLFGFRYATTMVADSVPA